jgi:hypothetical protein
MSNKTYIGDGVYVELDDNTGGIVLTVEDGIEATNTIYLEPSVLAQLNTFVRREFCS